MEHALLETVPQVGELQWIGVSSAPRSEIQSLQEVLVEVGTGLTGDHHSTGKPGGKRQVTLIQMEHLPVIASLVQQESVSPVQLRRNLVISGINLTSLKKQRFQIGEVILECTGECVPCGLMEENLGPGGFQAMRGHGGITARVIQGGTLRLGDNVKHLGPSEE